MSLLEEAGKRPYLSALVVLGGGALLWMTVGGSSASTATQSSGVSQPSDAAIAAQTEMARAQLEADTTTTLAQLSAERDVTLAGLDTAVQLKGIESSFNLGTLQINADNARSARETAATERMFSTQIAYEVNADNNATLRGINQDTLTYNAAISQQATDRYVAETAAAAQIQAAKKSKSKGFSFGPISIHW